MNLEKNQYSSYVSQDTVDDFRGIEKGNFSFKKFFISSIAAFFMVALAFQPLLFSVVESFNFSKDTAVTASQTQSENVYAFCGAGGDIGGGMSSKVSWNGLINNMPNPDQGGSRIFTLQSGYSRGLGIVNYHGEGDGGGSWGVTPASERPSSVKSVIDSADYKALLEERRTLGNCVFNFGPIVGNTLLGASDLLLTFSSAITSMAINPTIICDSQENNDGKFCIPLTEIIGGSGDSDRGILGTLFDGVYMPLMTMAAIITGIWFMWSGLARRKFREAFIGLGKAILVFFISLFISTNTATLVNFPVKATGAITSCVVGAFSGENCFDNSSTKSGGSEIVVDSSKVCESTSSASAFSSGMSHTVDRLNCQIWKSFVLEPYSRMQFGQSFEDLDTKSGPTADFISEKKLKSPDDGSTISGDTFCVNLSTTTAPNSMKRRLSTTSSTKVCNLAAYQMMLRVETTDDGPHMEAGPEGGSKIDKRWYNIVAVTAKSNQGEDSSEDSVNLWTSWAPSGVSGFTNALNYGIMSAFGSLVISIIQIVIGFTTLLFLISSILLMIFAPIFLLIGFIPGRGMSIFLGWVEQITSNILKYLISMVFLIASVSILGAALGASSNTFEALILLAILGLALLLYRGEIVNMLGRANMGGTQLSDKFSQSMKGGLKRTGRAASVVGGSALGGAFAGQKPHTAAFEGVKRELSRGNGFVANTIRQNERFHTAKDKEAKEIQNDFAEGVNRSQGRVEESVRTFESKEREVGDNAKDIKANNAVIENMNDAVSGNVAAAEEILIKLEVENPTGADYINERTQLETEAANLNAEFQNAINSGDATQDEIDDIERRMDINRSRFEDLENFDDLSDEEIADIERAKSELSADTRWKDLDSDSFDKVRDAIYDNAILQDDNERIALEQEGLADQIIAQREAVAEEELRRYYHDQVTDEMRRKRGGKLKAGDLKKIKKEANRRFEADSLYTTNPDGSRTVEYAMDSEGNYDLEAMRNSDKASERAKAEIIEERMDFDRSLKQMDGIINRNDNISKVKTFDDF